MNLSWWKSQRVLLDFFFLLLKNRRQVVVEGGASSCELSIDRPRWWREVHGWSWRGSTGGPYSFGALVEENKLQLKTDTTHSMVCTLGHSHLLNWDCRPKLHVWQNFRELATRGKFISTRISSTSPVIACQGLKVFQQWSGNISIICYWTGNPGQKEFYQDCRRADSAEGVAYYSVKEFVEGNIGVCLCL